MGKAIEQACRVFYQTRLSVVNTSLRPLLVGDSNALLQAFLGVLTGDIQCQTTEDLGGLYRRVFSSLRCRLFQAIFRQPVDETSASQSQQIDCGITCLDESIDEALVVGKVTGSLLINSEV